MHEEELRLEAARRRTGRLAADSTFVVMDGRRRERGLISPDERRQRERCSAAEAVCRGEAVAGGEREEVEEKAELHGSSLWSLQVHN